jgi:hypothetical protein
MRAALAILILCAAACGIPDGNPQMQAGNDCISCHNGTAATAWTAAGTLYGDPASGQDAGVSGAHVYIQDAAGRSFALTTNGAGNFYTAEALKFPIKVQAEMGGKRMAMVSSPPSGSCNTCHAVPASQDAPGRLFVPVQ